MRWIACTETLPKKETPVVAFIGGIPRILEIRTDSPSRDDTYQEYDYWDDPSNDGQEIAWHDVSHWMLLPEDPQV
jgi:hypothetical protein